MLLNHGYNKPMKYTFIILALLTLSLNSFSQELTEKQAVTLARLPLHCIVTEFPNKTGHVINDAKEASMSPKQLHPAFYGCLDWHSSVHGHWMLVKLLKDLPGISLKDSIIMILDNSIQEGMIKAEADYFANFKNSNTFERTYGWAWLLKLDEELYNYDDPMAKKWHTTLQPLTRKVVELWMAYLNNIRTGQESIQTLHSD